MRMWKRGISGSAVVAVCSLLALSCNDNDEGRGSTNGTGGEPLTSQQVVERGKAGVVQLFGRAGETFSYGTGFIIDADEGLAVTNAHVVQGLTALKARWEDTEPVAAQVRGASLCNDLAVVKLTSLPAGANALPWGGSETVENQDTVVALGYPTSFSEELEREALVTTSGAVQAPSVDAQPDDGLPRFPGMIQHDATVNPGNSGGPLLNDRAEVVGVNTLTNPEAENQFYAISSAEVRPQLEALSAGQAPDDIGLNVAPFSQVLLSDVFESVGLDPADGQAVDDYLFNEQGINGLWVWGSATRSPAEVARLVFGDLITHVDGVPVTSVVELCDIVQSASPGQVLRMSGIYILSGGDENFLSEWNTRLKMPRIDPGSDPDTGRGDESNEER